jgi:hypothetical protein
MPNKFTYHGGGILSKTRSDGKTVYFIRYTYQGKRITEKTGLQLERAKGRIESRREQLEDPNFVPPPVKRKRDRKRGQITFREFGKVFLRDWASKRKSKRLRSGVLPLGPRLGYQ